MRRVPALMLSSATILQKPTCEGSSNAAAEFQRASHLDDADNIRYFSPKSIIVFLLALLWAYRRKDWVRLENHRVHVLFNFDERFTIEPFVVREVEPQDVGVDFRALLVRVLAKPITERGMQQVRRGVRAADCGTALLVDFCAYGCANFKQAFLERSDMNDKFSVVLSALDDEFRGACVKDAGIANLPAFLAIERGLVQDDAQLLWTRSLWRFRQVFHRQESLGLSRLQPRSFDIRGIPEDWLSS